jgi:ABC-2 type transport system ATP-binding protein
MTTAEVAASPHAATPVPPADAARGIVAEGLRKAYGRTQALDGLYLRVAPGEIFGLIGPNGAGKTTTLRILAGLLLPDAGRVTIAGIDALRHPRKVRRLIGYMPEDFGLYDELRVWEYLDFYADCFGISGGERRALIDDLLNLVDLTGKRDAEVAGLSRGMRQRLCLAHALIHDPAVLILDEPASGLDPRARVELREILRTLAGMGKAIVISSHILSELAEICTALGILHRGRMVAGGTLEEIAEQAGGRPLAVRLAPGANLDPAIAVARRTPGVAAVRVTGDDLLVDFSGDAAAMAALLAALVGAGLPVVHFGERPGTLEEFFLTLTDAEDGATAEREDGAPEPAVSGSVAPPDGAATGEGDQPA